MLPSAAELYADLVNHLSSLPPEVNRYDAAAEWLIQFNEVLSIPSARVVERVGAILLFVLFPILLLAAFNLLYRRRAFSAWSCWFTIDHGLVKPNASNLLAVTVSAFGIFSIAEIAVELACPVDALGPNSLAWYPLSGIRYCLLFQCGVAYYWAVAGSCLAVHASNSEFNIVPGARLAKGGRSWYCMAWFVNITAMLLSIVSIAGPVALFTISGLAGRPFRRETLAVVINLFSSASMYDPATFRPAMLIPYFQPLLVVLPDGDRALRTFTAGWMLWICLAVIILVLLTPFSIAQIKLLRRMAKAKKALQPGNTGVVSIPDSISPRQRSGGWRRYLSGGPTEYHAVILVTCMVWIMVLVHAALAISVYVETEHLHPVTIPAILARWVGQVGVCIAATTAFVLPLLDLGHSRPTFDARRTSRADVSFGASAAARQQSSAEDRPAFAVSLPEEEDGLASVDKDEKADSPVDDGHARA